MFRQLRVIFTAAAVLLTVFGGVAVAQEEDKAVVTVFHAVPAADGFPADVYLDGNLVIDGFVFETASDSFELAGGPSTLEIFSDGSDPATDTPAVSTPVTFDAGKNYSIVAQLADGAPVITVYENDLTGVGPGESRVTFRQTSDEAALDVAFGDGPAFTAIAPTEEATANVEAGESSLNITNSSGATIFSDSVDIAGGTLTVLYAVGDPLAGTFDLLVQEIPISQVSPSGVPTGDGGAKSASQPIGVAAGLALTGLAAVALLGNRRLT